LFGLLITILWVLLPFAMFGMKPLLRELIAETCHSNNILQQRLPDLGRRPSAPSVPQPDAYKSALAEADEERRAARKAQGLST